MASHLLGVLEPSIVLQVNRDAGRPPGSALCFILRGGKESCFVSFCELFGRTFCDCSGSQALLSNAAVLALQELAAQHVEFERVVGRATFSARVLRTKRHFLAQVTNPQVFVNAS